MLGEENDVKYVAIISGRYNIKLFPINILKEILNSKLRKINRVFLISVFTNYHLIYIHIYISDSLMVVMEFASKGNLKGYLNDHRTIVDGTNSLTSQKLITFATEIACGMDHVTRLNVISFFL